MILGIMQPYFFPYLGYFDLINRCDLWLVFDIVQFTNKSWITRNRIHHPTEGWQYINVPVRKHNRDTIINDIRLRDPESALSRIQGQLSHYKKFAPFFKEVHRLIQASFWQLSTDSLVELNINCLKQVCRYIDVPFRYKRYSELRLNLPPISHPGQWALEISHLLRAKKYINPPGGRALLDVNEFEGRGIDIEFTQVPDFKYECSPYEFIDSLSIIDILMWCPPGEVKEELNKYKLSKMSKQPP